MMGGQASNSVVLTTNRKYARKSRGGCFSCKSRKVKCSETRPSCEGCQARDLCCIYPSKAQRWNVSRKTPRRVDGADSAPLARRSLDASLRSFSAADFRYFHHFLTVGYPHLPYDSEGAWTSEIPQLAHHYEPLLHAILSLGASHSVLLSAGLAESKDAIYHRGLALSGFRTMLAKEHYTNTELDVMLGICYSLTLQSGFMKDCLADFATMIRGCALITKQIMLRGLSSTAFCLDPTSHVQSVLQELRSASCLDPVLLRVGILSLETFGNTLTQDSHREFRDALLQTLSALQRSGMESYISLQQIYAVLFTMDEPTFRDFMAEENFPTKILFAYFATILILMQPYLLHEVPTRLSMYRVFGSMYGWLDSIYRCLPVEMRGYVKWPYTVTRAFQLNHHAFGQDVYGLVHWALASACDSVEQPDGSGSLSLVSRNNLIET